MHNVGSYLGSNLCKAFASITEERFEVIGTLKKEGEVKPRSVSKIVETTPEALAAAFFECELTVLDLLGQHDAAETLLEAIAGVRELEEDKVLVGLSSVMTWTRTSLDADEPEKALTEEEYKRRRPHSNFKELLALEKMVTKSKRTGLRTHVVRRVTSVVWSWGPVPWRQLWQRRRLCTMCSCVLAGRCWPHLWPRGGPISLIVQDSVELRATAASKHE